MSGRRTWPAVALLLDSGEPGFEALVAPGHVSTIMGPEEWEFVPRRSRHADRGRGIPAGLAARGPVLGAAADARGQVLPRQLLPAGGAAGRQRRGAALHRRHDGRRRRQLARHRYDPALGLRAEASATRQHDSRVQLPSYTEIARKRAGQMPPGCDCAKVVLGRIYPNECRLYGLACTPRHPIGPVHGLGRGRLPHLVGERRARKRVGRAQGVRAPLEREPGRGRPGRPLDRDDRPRAGGRLSPVRLPARARTTGSTVSCATCAATSKSWCAAPAAAHRPDSSATSSSARRRSRIPVDRARPPTARRRPGRILHRANRAPPTQPQISVPPDFFACDDCVRRTGRSCRPAAPLSRSSTARSAGHATRIIESLPYDRPNTSMRALPALRRLPARVPGPARPAVPCRARRLPRMRTAPRVLRARCTDDPQ